MANFIDFTTDAQKEYDTAKAFLTLCYNQPHAEGYFGATDAGNDSKSNDLNRFVEYREWLKSVLYLRQDSMWYCSDVESIVHTFDYYPGHGIYYNGSMAVARYILENNRCGLDSAYFAQGLAGAPLGRYNVWKDTVKDSLTEPRPDTTVPSIDSIGLSILRGPKAAVVSAPLAMGEDHLLNLRVTENPFTRGTEVKFVLADYGLVTFELFDVLGHSVTNNGLGQVLDPGEHTFEIDGSKLPTGNYIARLTYHNGDVKSVMVSKE